MAVSRRLRFEILRRDGHTCRYCGAMAPTVELDIDHVIPSTLGGTDDPSNLVTACKPCNGGKSSIAPDTPLVADVAADMLRWRRAIEQAHLEFEAERAVTRQLCDQFKAKWQGWTYPYEVTDPPPPRVLTGDPLIDNWHSLMSWDACHSEPLAVNDGALIILAKRGYTTEVRRKANQSLKQFAELLGGSIDRIIVEHAPTVDAPPPPPSATTRTERRPVHLDDNWRESVTRFLSAGLTIGDLERLIDITMNKPNLRNLDTFRYFCGCAWREITDLQESARRIIESEGSQGE